MPTAPATCPGPVTQLAVARSRYLLVDLGRLAAAYAIVWLHTARSTTMVLSVSWTRFAVPFFAATAAYLVVIGATRAPQRTLAEYLPARLRRVFGPFIVWNLVYLAFKWAKWRALPEQPNDFPWAEILVFGSAYHLWFLPFIGLVSLALFAAARVAMLTRARGLVIGGLSLVGCGIAMCAGSVSAGPATGADASTWSAWPAWSFAWNCLPATLWGAALALANSHGVSGDVFSGKRRPGAQAFAWLTFALLEVCLAWYGRQVLLENLAGLALLYAALGLRVGRDDAPRRLRLANVAAVCGTLAMGVYLAHVLIIKTCEAIATRCQTPITPALDVSVFLLAAGGGTGLAWLLGRWKCTRWLLG